MPQISLKNVHFHKNIISILKGFLFLKVLHLKGDFFQKRRLGTVPSALKNRFF